MGKEIQVDKNYRSIHENEKISFSFIKGFKISFHDESSTITFESSIYTGSEKVLINNQIVSKKRNFRRKTEHHFQYNENEYAIKFSINGYITYSWTCSLFKNGALIKEFECKNVQNEQSFYKKHPETIFGAITGAAFALGYISLNTLLLIVVFGTIFSLLYMRQFLLVRESFGTSDS
jgi:hypothetical protein